ncbi:hypothetical protein [Zunongwangia sp.]
MKETKTENDLKNYCEQIIIFYQEEFDEIFNGIMMKRRVFKNILI